MKKRALQTTAFAWLVSLGATGCFRTTHSVRLSPLDTDYPVSASSAYVSKGRIVEQTDYKVLDTFTFQKTLEGPVLDETTTPLLIERELDREIAKHQGHAITNLSISGTQYDAGSHDTAANFRSFAVGMWIGGATLLGLWAIKRDDSVPLIAGSILGGVGTTSYLLSYAANSPAIWTIEVQGQVVRSSSAAEQPTSQKSEQPATVWATLGPTLRAASADPSPPKAVFAKNVFGVNW